MTNAVLRMALALLLGSCGFVVFSGMVGQGDPTRVAAADLTVEEVNALLDAVVLVAEPVRLAFQWRPALKDPNDDMVLETAINGRADRLVTFNRRDFGTVGLQFGIVAVAPGSAVELLED